MSTLDEGVERMDLRKRGLTVFVLLLVVLVFSGCGTKSAEDVLGSLEKKLNNLESYRAAGDMTLQTGKEPQTYDVEVWFKTPDFYRIALTSQQREVTQIILRNEEGVFVLTPHLNKSFRFQSGWPENQGQVYLYQSLVKAILSDSEREFENAENGYVFQAKAEYQTRSLEQQQIWINEEMAPTKVIVSDSNMNPVVEVNFSNFAFDVDFEPDAFEKERNMSSAWLDSVPAISEELSAESFGVIEPAYIPEGVTYSGVEKAEGNDQAVVLHYHGEHEYTLMEERPDVQPASFPFGEPVNLGFTVGVLTNSAADESGKKMLTWTYDGVEFTLTGELPRDELINVAESVYDQPGK